MGRDALLRLEGIGKRFAGGIVGLDGIDLEVASGEFLTLLGPSGCGKTTTLRVIAGFEAPTSGRVLLDGRDVTALRPFDRPINTVFQDYALFPNMTVAENVGFGLSIRKVAGAERKRRVAEALELVGLGDKAGARPQALSGGQRQRVALARALVCEPRLLLLDEPLSALDAHLREHMQVELKRLQTTLGVTFVMVTHDQTEALSISDRIVVMNKARIEQIADPATLYDRPATAFVAGFIGAMNILDGVCVSSGSAHVRFEAGGLTFDMECPESVAIGDRRAICVRPEDFAIAYPGAEGAAQGRAASVVFHGRSLRLHVELACGMTVIVDAPRQFGGATPAAGDAVAVSVRRGANCVALPAR
ncbi:MAG: ABC transporter ATP-binding protein [Hansschlegelia sp.]